MAGTRIFVHHDGGLGDTILSLPAISLLRRAASFLHLAARSDIACFLRDQGCVDEASDCGSSFYLPLYERYPDQRLKKMLSCFDHAYLFTSAPRPDMVLSLSEAVLHVRTILTIPPPESPMHVSLYRAHQLPLLNRLTQEETSNSPLRRHGQKRHHSGNGIPRIILHPGSGGRKNWPVDRYIALAEELRRERGCSIVFIAGPAEASAVRRRLTHFADGERGVLIADASLSEVASLLADAALYIGNDSGISHLAAAIGTPMLAIFGPTDPRLWAPAGECVCVVRSSADCAPCGSRVAACPEQHCLFALSVDQILEEAMKMLDQH